MSDEQLRYEEEKHQYEEEKHQYEEEKHQYEEETLESMYVKVVSVALDCDPIPAKDRADGKLEPPWEVFARVKRERDIWIAEAERWRKNTDLYHTVLGQRDRLAEAARTLPDYDAGLLNDFGGGDAGWWQDYIRAEIGRANEYWREALAAVEGGKP